MLYARFYLYIVLLFTLGTASASDAPSLIHEIPRILSQNLDLKGMGPQWESRNTEVINGETFLVSKNPSYSGRSKGEGSILDIEFKAIAECRERGSHVSGRIDEVEYTLVWRDANEQEWRREICKVKGPIALAGSYQLETGTFDVTLEAARMTTETAGPELQLTTEVADLSSRTSLDDRGTLHLEEASALTQFNIINASPRTMAGFEAVKWAVGLLGVTELRHEFVTDQRTSDGQLSMNATWSFSLRTKTHALVESKGNTDVAFDENRDGNMSFKAALDFNEIDPFMGLANDFLPKLAERVELGPFASEVAGGQLNAFREAVTNMNVLAYIDFVATEGGTDTKTSINELSISTDKGQRIAWKAFVHSIEGQAGQPAQESSDIAIYSNIPTQVAARAALQIMNAAMIEKALPRATPDRKHTQLKTAVDASLPEFVRWLHSLSRAEGDGRVWDIQVPLGPAATRDQRLRVMGKPLRSLGDLSGSLL